ncbi:helix-turn-helix domain-containing protein [Halomonas sp. BC04]|uniref:helix-turn-helix domain-containing protein n=1 Tax=Halomonas sp. BC04 TaxID=1403540 RepID=UPI0003ED672B|nr:helix-turn-helix transcriptional regulator [Halomonas sp. BC04]EWH00805.1 hypothetical protein Q427_17455 [Halomonas sp. BC04]
MIVPQDGHLRLDRERLKQHLKRLGLSQLALAEHCFDRRLYVSIASIKRAESGKALLHRTAQSIWISPHLHGESVDAANNFVIQKWVDDEPVTR